MTQSLVAFLAVVATGQVSSPTTGPAATAAATQATSAPSTRRVGSSEWPMFRGDPQNTGVADTRLPERLRVRWRYELAEGTSSTAAIDAGTVYIGADDKHLYAVDLGTGGLRWKYAAQDAIESSPTVYRGLVVFGDNAGVLQACDARTGEGRWMFKAGDRIVSSVNVDGEHLIFGSYDRHVYCLRCSDGEAVWRYDVAERVHGTPGIDNGRALFAACDGELHVLSLADGTPDRSIPLGSVSGSAAAIQGARVYLGTYGQEVLGIDWIAGKVAWRFEDKDRSFPFLSSPAIADGLIVIGCQDKRLRALDAATGSQRWEFVTKGRIDSSPVVVGKRVFVGSADGNLYEIDLPTGKERWRFEAGGGIYASPAVGEGCLVIGNDEGAVYCLGEAPAPQPR